MGRAILNYTTSIDVNKTVGEIQGILASGGANTIQMEYDLDGQPIALQFAIIHLNQPLHFRLPSNIDGVYRSLCASTKVTKAQRTIQQARRVSWRIVKDWVEAQIAIVESNQAEMAEVFMPYCFDAKSGKTAYAVFTEQRQKQLSAGGNK